MHNWYLDAPFEPRELSGLSNRQRSERAAWQASIRQALAEVGGDPTHGS